MTRRTPLPPPPRRRGANLYVMAHGLETLYQHLGCPRWFWPLVCLLLAVLAGLAGTDYDPALHG